MWVIRQSVPQRRDLIAQSLREHARRTGADHKWSVPHPPDYEPTKMRIWRNGNMSRKRRSFTPDYKEEAAKLVIETSRPIAESARDIGINEQTLRNWADHSSPL